MAVRNDFITLAFGYMTAIIVNKLTLYKYNINKKVKLLSIELKK